MTDRSDLLYLIADIQEAIEPYVDEDVDRAIIETAARAAVQALLDNNVLDVED